MWIILLIGYVALAAWMGDHKETAPGWTERDRQRQWEERS